MAMAKAASVNKGYKKFTCAKIKVPTYKKSLNLRE